MKNPCLIGMLDWTTLKNTKFPDWDLMIRTPGENKIYFFGDFMIRHGDRDSGAKKAEHITKNGKYLCGHFHKFITYRRAVQLGCGAKLGPGYIGNEVNAWQSQIATLTKYLGIAAISPKVVLHDKTRDVSRVSFRDMICEVPFYHIAK
jgi:hypothetical protein